MTLYDVICVAIIKMRIFFTGDFPVIYHSVKGNAQKIVPK